MVNYNAASLIATVAVLPWQARLPELRPIGFFALRGRAAESG